MTFALIRHGQTDWNLEGRMQGSTDIPLNATGRDQARVAGGILTDAGEPWDVVVSSPLGRARETASIIAEALGVPLGDTYAGLAEQDFGDAEGLLVTEVFDRWPERIYPEMESDVAVGLRGAEALQLITDEYSGARVLAIAHGTLIRRTFSALSGHPYDGFPRLENASISRLQRSTEEWVIETVGGVPYTQVLRDAELLEQR